ncbi:MAG: hypothetical protein IJD79_04075 [Clostridia bacterium]|nr:hypothetical protein [Clostridia bacterium]
MEKKYVTYEEFGAIGDGKADDFEAIEKAHIYANANALSVKAKSDATYYIADKFVRSIPVDYDVDFNGANFIVNDNAENAFEFRNIPLFLIKRKDITVYEGEALIEKIGENVKIEKHATSLPWLAPLLKEDSYVRVSNANHKDFIRFGSNQNNGTTRQDVMIVYKDGTIDPGTLPAFGYEKLTKLEIFPEKEPLITIKNGNFASICCRSVKETDFKNVYRSYQRGFRVERADVTFENMTHKMLDEPPIITDSGMDELTSRFGERNESYPYQGFIVGMLANRLTIKDCRLTSHTTYYEDKPATISTGWKVPNPVPMGSYDMYFHYSNKVSLINLKQECATGLGDKRYWGIMASNYCKNFYLEGCEMNRFDAHQGFWGGVLKDCTFGFAINLTGGGDLYLENVTKLTTSDFFSLRGDYGSSFEGRIFMKNCRHAGMAAYNTVMGHKYPDIPDINELKLISMVYVGTGELFYNWDFGYELYLPIEVHIDGFSCDKNVPVYVFSNEPDDRFENVHKHQHAITKILSVKNADCIIKNAKDDECKLINGIQRT